MSHHFTLYDWFECSEVLPRVWVIREPHHHEDVQSYLVVGDRRALLFDTGMGVYPIRHVVARVTDLPVTVINSHSHFDHIGGNHEFDEIYALACDYDGDDIETQGIGTDTLDSYHFFEGFHDTRHAVSRDTFRIRPFRRSGYLGDGDTVDIAPFRFTVMSAPGHSSDSLVLSAESTGLLLAGDTVYP